MKNETEAMLEKHYPNQCCLQKILDQRKITLSLIKSRVLKSKLNGKKMFYGDLRALSDVLADIEAINNEAITFEFIKRNMILNGEKLNVDVLRHRGKTFISPIVSFEDAVFVCDRYLDLQYESVVRFQINDKLGVDHFFLGIKGQNPVACWNEHRKSLVLYEFNHTLTDRLLYNNFPTEYAKNVVCVWKKGTVAKRISTEKKGTEKE